MTNDWLSNAVEQRRPFDLGELHVDFEGRQATIYVHGDAPPVDVPGDPASLREWTRTDVRGMYRPLTGALGMRRGWRARVPVASLFDALDAIYPLARRHIAMAAEGTLRVATAGDVLGRQSGRYESASRITTDRVAIARNELCGACVKTPFWEDPAMPVDEGVIPCPEPCSVFVSLARELVVLKDATDPVDPDSAIQFAAFEEPGNPTRERCIARLRDTRPESARS